MSDESNEYELLVRTMDGTPQYSALRRGEWVEAFANPDDPMSPMIQIEYDGAKKIQLTYYVNRQRVGLRVVHSSSPTVSLTPEPREPHVEEVDHPEHYGGADDPYEAVKVIEAWGLGFNLGNTVKYIARAGKKPNVPTLVDLKKARWYLDREISLLEQGERDG